MEKTFKDCMKEVNVLWNEQYEKATHADELMEECETIEAKMVTLLEEIATNFPNEYQTYLDSFKNVEIRLEKENIIKIVEDSPSED